MAQFFQTSGSGRLALICTGLAVLIATWLLVRMVWLVVSGPEVDAAPVPPVPRIAQTAAQAGEFRWQLFGQSQSLATPVRPITTVSRSSLRLMGVVSGADGYAMIAESGGAEAVFRVGDELPDGSQLRAIEPNQVVLSANGQDEILPLDRDRVSPGSAPGARATPTARADIGSSLPGLRGFQAPTGISAASMPELARTSGLDLNAMASGLSVMPVRGGGFRLRAGQNAALFARLGLQVNDIVTAVNGQPLQSEDQVQALFADVLQRGEVAITITRQGREMVLRPDLEEIIRSLQNP